MAEVWDDSPLPPNVRVGEGARLERRMETFQRFYSRRDPGLVLGPRVAVYTWTSFGIWDDGVVEVGADSIVVGATFMCYERISVGQRVVISYDVSIADSDFHPRDAAQRHVDTIAISPEGDRSLRPPVDTAPVTIGDDAWIGIGAIVLKGVTIGAGARIGPGAVVTRDVAAGVTVMGNPAREVAA
jgi:acetyltransferase-like isoleucine patch superfamily enzyme